MITCKHCETPQFLNIVASRVYFVNGELVDEVTEKYECTLCGSEGLLEWSESKGPKVSGDVELDEGSEQVCL